LLLFWLSAQSFDVNPRLFDVSALSCRFSLATSSMNTVDSWLAREIETFLKRESIGSGWTRVSVLTSTLCLAPLRAVAGNSIAVVEMAVLTGFEFYALLLSRRAMIGPSGPMDCNNRSVTIGNVQRLPDRH
jgi:hypothetical protein